MIEYGFSSMSTYPFILSRYVWSWSLRGPTLEQRFREVCREFQKAWEEFERDFRGIF